MVNLMVFVYYLVEDCYISPSILIVLFIIDDLYILF